MSEVLAYGKISQLLKQGKTIAYPTEAMFGFGCDIYNEKAVNKILQIKNRDLKHGLIIIAANWQQVADLIAPIEKPLLENVLKNWPSHVTYVFPASSKAPKWITGEHKTIAIRIPDHKIAREICHHFGGPIVSTSANKQGEVALKAAANVSKQFGHDIDHIVDENIGSATHASVIYNVLTQKILRD